MKYFWIPILLFLSLSACKSGFDASSKYTGNTGDKLKIVNRHDVESTKKSVTYTTSESGQTEQSDEALLSGRHSDVDEHESIAEQSAAEVGSNSLYSANAVALEVEEEGTQQKSSQRTLSKKTESLGRSLEIDVLMQSNSALHQDGDDDKYYNEDGSPKKEAFAIASFWSALSVVLVVIIPGLAVLGPLVGIVFGFIALRKIKQSDNVLKGRGMAIAGIIIGILVIAAIAIFMATFGGGT